MCAKSLNPEPLAVTRTMTIVNGVSDSPRVRRSSRVQVSIAAPQPFARPLAVALFAGYLGDTWTWDGTTWTKHSPATRPPDRCCMGMAYDITRAQTVLFGGLDYPLYLADTWTWDGTNWTSQDPATGPAKRQGPGMSYDAAR